MEIHFIFLALGGLLLIGVLADEVSRRTWLPRVTLMILFGVAAGPSGFNLLPPDFQRWYGFLASAALTMVAFSSAANFPSPLCAAMAKQY